jgi:hypothetical protein
VAAGVGDSEPAEQIRFDLAYLTPYLPSKADEATQRAWVDEAVAALGGKGSAKLGQVMGAVMKAHKDEVDAACCAASSRRRCAELLGTCRMNRGEGTAPAGPRRRPQRDPGRPFHPVEFTHFSGSGSRSSTISSAVQVHGRVWQPLHR